VFHISIWGLGGLFGGTVHQSSLCESEAFRI